MLVTGAPLLMCAISRVLAEVWFLGARLHRKPGCLDAWMAVWLLSDVQKETRWQCHRSLLAGGALVGETGGEENAPPPSPG